MKIKRKGILSILGHGNVLEAILQGVDINSDPLLACITIGCIRNLR